MCVRAHAMRVSIFHRLLALSLQRGTRQSKAHYTAITRRFPAIESWEIRDRENIIYLSHMEVNGDRQTRRHADTPRMGRRWAVLVSIVELRSLAIQLPNDVVVLMCVCVCVGLCCNLISCRYCRYLLGILYNRLSGLTGPLTLSNYDKRHVGAVDTP